MIKRSGRTKNKYFCNNCIDRNYLIECECGCGEIIFRYNERSKLMRFKYGHANKGSNNGQYKGGRKKHENYWMLLMPQYFSSEKSGYVKEHVYFFQEYYQCCLLPWGIVHHIIPVSEDYCNNMIYNLMGMTNKQHTILHSKFREYKTKDKSDRKCSDLNCKDPYKRYHDKKGHEQWLGNEIDGWKCIKCYSIWYEKNRRKRR